MFTATLSKTVLFDEHQEHHIQRELIARIELRLGGRYPDGVIMVVDDLRIE